MLPTLPPSSGSTEKYPAPPTSRLRAVFLFLSQKLAVLKEHMTRTTAPRLGEDPERDMIELVSHMRKLSTDMRTLTGDVAENSLLTQATLDKQIELQDHQSATDKKLDEMVVKNEEMLTVFNAGKKGVGFFQWLGRTLYSLARWAGPILAVGGALYALWHGAPSEGPK
jgi:hypothetical protein